MLGVRLVVYSYYMHAQTNNASLLPLITGETHARTHTHYTARACITHTNTHMHTDPTQNTHIHKHAHKGTHTRAPTHIPTLARTHIPRPDTHSHVHKNKQPTYQKIFTQNLQVIVSGNLVRDRCPCGPEGIPDLLQRIRVITITHFCRGFRGDVDASMLQQNTETVIE